MRTRGIGLPAIEGDRLRGWKRFSEILRLFADSMRRLDDVIPGTVNCRGMGPMMM